MLKFKYKVVHSKKNPGMKYIRWECTWDGRHDNDVFKDDAKHWPLHPFFNTFVFQDDLRDHDNLLAKLRKQKKKAVYLFPPKRISKKERERLRAGGFVIWDEDFGPPMKYSRDDIEKMHPKHMRKIGDYVAYNPATLGLCKILADKKNIGKHSGNTGHYCYWMNALAALCLLWD